MIIKPATQDDIAWLVTTSLAAYQDDFATLLPECDWSAFDAAHFTQRFNRQWPEIRIVMQGTEPAGFTLIIDRHIEMFFVATGYRDRGVGEAMLRDAIMQGATTLECFAANEGARRFYARHGWREAEASTRIFAGVKCNFIRLSVAPG